MTKEKKARREFIKIPHNISDMINNLLLTYLKKDLLSFLIGYQMPIFFAVAIFTDKGSHLFLRQVLYIRYFESHVTGN